MQQTLDPTSEAVAQARSYTERFRARLLHLLSFVPDDKLTWTPSPTAKSSLRIVAHCALTSKFLADVITGSMPESMPSAEEFLKGLHEAEEAITTREGAIALVKENTAELFKAIDTVNAANIDSTPNSPFGAIAMRFWMSHGGDQMAGHAGQLEYLQTIWGDLDNHSAG
jgi:hypothetical protein